MAESSIDQQWKSVQNSVQSAIADNFPIEGRRNRMVLHGITIDDKGADHTDLSSQEAAKINGRTWGAPVYADISLIDKVTGNEIDRNKIKLLTLPKPTKRYSYIVDGNEWQIDNLWRLRSGVYAHIKQNGKLEAEFNLGTPLARQPRIYIPFDPEKKTFKLEHGDSGFSLYAVLKTLGVEDSAMKKAWGEEIYKVNSINPAKVDKDVTKLYEKLSKKGVKSSSDSLKDKSEAIIEAFHNAALLPETTKATLGKPIDHVSGEALLLASKRILSVARGEIPQDDRDSLIFKELDSIEDFLGKKLSKYKTQRTILQKINHNIDRQVKVRDVISGDLFNKPIVDFFSKDTLSRNPEQVNPLEMMVNHRATTIISPEMGGIKNEQSVTSAMKLINPSHFGFLDPINTPECSPNYVKVFTKLGWKRWDEVTIDDEFLCRPAGSFNFWRETTEFRKAERIISQPYKGTMYGMDNGKIAYLVTPNHRVLCRPLDEGSLLRIVTADLAHDRPRFFPVAHTPVVHESYPTHFDLPKFPYYDKNIEKIDMGDWAEFMGWFLSEGSTCVSDYSVNISQSKSVNPNEYTAIQTLLNRLPFGKWCTPVIGTSFTKGHKQLSNYLKQFGDCYNKFIPDYIFTASIEARERFIEAMLLGDGRLYSNRKPDSRVKSYPQKVYTTTSPRLANDFERLAIEMGHSVSHNIYADKREERYYDMHEIRILRHKERAGRPNSTINIGSGTPREKFVHQYFTQEYDGMVYSATVPGSLLFIKMPNRIGMWTGNSEKTGITLHLPLGVSKEGNEAKMQVYDLKEGKFRSVGPAEMHVENIVLPDQVTWKQQKPVPRAASVKMKDPKTNEIIHKPFSEGRFLVLTAQQLFDEATNLIPFLQNDQGNRTMTAARQATQAVSLHYREAPLVQVKTPSQYSFERIVGTDWAVESPVDGKIVALNKNEHNGHTDSIVIQGKDGVTRPPIQIYNHFPLNDSKSFIHATPNVKVGDSVKRNQVIADSNFTRDGTLSLGTNLRITYLPYKGYNFEDGIVISESAAKKLSSSHMHRKTIDINPERDFVDKKKFASYASTTAKRLTTAQLAKIGDDGIIHVGQKVLPGDVLVAAVGKRDLVGEVARAIGRLDKKMFAFEDKSIVWDSQHEGEVVKVTKNPNGKGATVFVKTIEPAEIGDKIVGRHGNKGILCYSNDSEVLGEFGWKLFKDLKHGEKVCTLNPETRNIEYQTPTAYIEKPHDGPMYSYQGRRLNLLVTPDHSLYVRTRRGKFKLEKAQDCAGMPRLHLRTGNWQGKELETITIPGKINSKLPKYGEPREYNADLFLAFFGYWITEGCIGKNNSHIHIGQSKEVHPETYENIIKVLTELGYHTCKQPTDLVISDPRLGTWLKQFGLSLQKFIPREFLELSQRQLRILADAIFEGDGGVYYREKDNHTRHELFTSSKQLADDYQELALKLGMSANIKPQVREGRNIEYVVRWSLKDEVWTNNDKRFDNEGMVDYKGLVYCVDVPNHIIYVRRQGIPVWCGNCAILPDVDMPRIGGPDGTHTEVLMNPMGVPSRINLGQALETAAAKIAIKTGKPYMVQNFDSKTPDYKQLVVDQLKEHGLSDQDAMYDPHTGKKLGDALNGHQYIMKLKHQVEKKLAVRANGPNYSIDRAPKGTGAEHPGQAIGQLEFYALLAHGARHNLREMATYKAEEHLGDNNNKAEAVEFWQRVQTGQPLPMPKIPFVYKKFEAMLTGLGINVKKEGNELVLQPLTDKGILALSNGEIKDPGRVLRGKDAKELEKGLFDPKVTGGLPDDVGKGLKWCFRASTKIITDAGAIHIDKIVNNKLQVKVLSKNLITGEVEYKKIVNYWRNKVDEPLIGLKYNYTGFYESFFMGNRALWCTPGHEIYSTDGLVHAKDMEGKAALTITWAQVNSKLKLTTEPCVITAIDKSATKKHSIVKYVYNIEVEDNHNYFANGVLVGNSHIVLPEVVPNPIFVGTKQHPGPAVILSGLKFDEFESVARGQKSISIPGKAGEKTGGQAISDLLSIVKVKPEIEKLKVELPTLRGTNLDKANRKIKYLMAIDKLDMKPTEAYMLKNVPVLPPIFRPIVKMPDGSLRFDDINHYYKALGHINQQFETAPKELGDDGVKDLREDLYDITRSLAGIPGGRPIYESNRQMKGLLDTIAGNSPKEGFFQKRLMKRRQELSMRSTIIPEPAMHLDHVGLPKDAAMELYKPFVVREMQTLGYSPVQSLREIKDGSNLAWKSLQNAMDKRPVLLKRDPALHKFSIMAFKPKITEGRAIKIHPLVTGGFNADFDGDLCLGTVFLIANQELTVKISKDCGIRTQIGVISDSQWWEQRRMEDSMAARFKEAVGYFFDGDIYICDLEDFPRAPEHITQGHIDFHPVPQGVSVISYNEATGGFCLAEVSHWSVHRDRLIELVNLKSGRQLVTDDDERAVYGLDENLRLVRKRPREAIGLFVPVAHTLNFAEPERKTLALPQGDDRLRPEAELSTQFGRLLGLLVGDGWVVTVNDKLKGQVALANIDEELIRLYGEDLKSVFYETPTITRTNRHGGDFGPDVESARHVVSSMAFAKLVYPLIGTKAQNKHLPPFYLTAPRDFRMGLLAGLLDTDGSISISNGKKNPQWMISYFSTSIRLVREISYLAKSLAIRSTITASKTPKGDNAWIVNFSTVDFHKLQEMPVLHSLKTNLFRDFFAGPAPAEKNSYAQIDIIPTPIWLARRLREEIKQNLGHSIYILLSAAQERKYISRYSAREILDRMPELANKPEFAFWAWMVRNTAVWWDKVESYQETGITETGFDLSVPGYETFMSVDGIILSNTMSAFVPLGDDAVRETYKMFPSNNLFSSTTGGIMYVPEQESLMGLHLLSKWGTKVNKEFSSFADAQKAKDNGTIKVTDVINIGGNQTTLGRALIAQHLPDTLKRNEHLNKQFLDPKFELTSRDIRALLDDVAKHDPKNFAFTVDNLKDLGNKYSYELGFSFGLKDLNVNKELRDDILKKSDAEAVKIRANNKLTPTQKHEQVVDVYTTATKEMVDKNRPDWEASNNSMYKMVASGSRGKINQFRQMTIAPMLMKDGAGNTISTPVRKSYSEGLDIGDYWTSLHGARMGTLQRVEGTSEPGILTKEIVNVVIPNMIVSRDCGTKEGIHLNIDDNDIYDRYLAAPVKLPNDQVIKAGTMIDANVTSTLKKHKIDRVVVRSPLKCEHGEGICAVCYGNSENGTLHEIGTNIGVIAGQSLGEPATQLAMNCNAAGNVILVKINKKLQYLTFEELWNSVLDPVQISGDLETKIPVELQVFDHDKFTEIRSIQRHKPKGDMIFVSTESGHAFIAQDSHPNWVRNTKESADIIVRTDNLEGKYIAITKHHFIWPWKLLCESIENDDKIITKDWSTISKLWRKFSTDGSNPSIHMSSSGFSLMLGKAKGDSGLSKIVQTTKVENYNDWTYDLSTSSKGFTVNGVRTHNSFHEGGVAASRGGASVDKFTRLKNLLEIPKTLKNAAILAKTNGPVTKIERDKATNGWNVRVGDEHHFIPAQRLPVYTIDGEERPLKVGMEVKKGKPISDGHVDPRELLSHTDIHTVQNHLTNELYNNVYKDERVRRRNIETVVRSLTNYTKIKDPGDSDHLPGDFALRTIVEEHNRNLPAGAFPIIHQPIVKGAKQMALESHEDWMARLNFQELRNTLLEGTSKGWRTNLHGSNPIAAYAVGQTFGLGTPDKKHNY